MDVHIDATEIFQMAQSMTGIEGMWEGELQKSSMVILHEGVGYAREEAPKGETGELAGSIVITEGPDAGGGAYGTDKEYAWQREEGGTIYPRNKEFLAFQLPDAVTPDNPEGWVFARKVTQEGSHYMQKSKDKLEPRLVPIYQLAFDRLMGAV